MPGRTGSDVVVRLYFLTLIHSHRAFKLQDANGETIAIYQPTRPTRYQVGDVYGELRFLRSAGAGTVVSSLYPTQRSESSIIP